MEKITIEEVVDVYMQNIQDNKDNPYPHREINGFELYLAVEVIFKRLQGLKVGAFDYIVIKEVGEAPENALTYCETPEMFLEVAELLRPNEEVEDV